MNVSSLFSVAGKTVAISGGTRGLGLMIAKAFVANGAHVVISSRSAEACAAAQEELERLACAAREEGTASEGGEKAVGSCLSSFPSDLSTEAGCHDFADGVASALRAHARGEGPDGDAGDDARPGGKLACGAGLNVLVNNSGTSWGSDSLESFPAKGWDKVLDLNLKSLFMCTQLALPMLERGSSIGDPSRIVNIGSVAGIGAGQPWRTYSYDASKAAVHHLTRRLSHELAASQITVNAIAPGVIPTSMSAQLETYATAEDQARAVPLQRLGSAEDIGGAALYLSSRAGSWITGEVIRVDGGTCVRPHAMGQKE